MNVARAGNFKPEHGPAPRPVLDPGPAFEARDIAASGTVQVHRIGALPIIAGGISPPFLPVHPSRPCAGVTFPCPGQVSPYGQALQTFAYSPHRRRLDVGPRGRHGVGSRGTPRRGAGSGCALHLPVFAVCDARSPLPADLDRSEGLSGLRAGTSGQRPLRRAAADPRAGPAVCEGRPSHSRERGRRTAHVRSLWHRTRQSALRGPSDRTRRAAAENAHGLERHGEFRTAAFPSS